MKNFLTFLFTAALAAALLLALPVSGEETVYKDTLRLHILAASDTTPDQEAKLFVRDALLGKYGTALNDVKSKKEAEAYLCPRLDEIKTYLQDLLCEEGLSYEVAVSLKEEWFDTRTYGDVTLPRGEYTALVVTLDKGKGQNFFCMLYPALCTTPALGETLKIAEEGYKSEAYGLITGKYAIRFRALEFFSDFFYH